MEQNMENDHNEDSVLFDGKMLNKLRRCNIIPSSPSEFQIFVRNLTGDAISDVVIEEVWKQIYTNKAGSALAFTPEIVSETQEQNLCNSLESDKKISGPSHESLQCGLRNNSKQKLSSHFEVQNLKKAELSSGESSAKMTNSDVDVTDIGSQLPIRNQNITLHSVSPVSRREMTNQILMPPEIKTSEQMEWHCARKNIKNSTLLEKDQVEDLSSSDCEVIEVVSLDNTSVNGSDSESSVEILNSIISTGRNSSKSACPIHGNNEITKSSNSWEKNRKSREQKVTLTDAHLGKDYNQMNNHGESVNTEKQQKDKKRSQKYKMLRSELKHVKSLLVNLLVSLKNPTMNDHDEGTSTTFHFDSGHKQKKRKSNESFHIKQQRKKEETNSRISSKEKLKASAFVEVNMSRKGTKSHQKNQQTANNSNCSRPIVVELDSNINDNKKRKKFNWREIIAEVLKSKPAMQMPVEKLKRTVIAKYYYCRGNVSQNTTVKFFRYLHSTPRVIVDGNMAIYINKPIIQVSSKSEKKQLVLKTRTTTKEYKVS